MNKLGTQQNWEQKILCPKKFGSQKIWVPKKFGSQKSLGPEKFWVLKLFGSRKSLGPENFWVLKNFGLKKFVSRKNLCPEKNCVSKKLGHKKFRSQNILVPKKFWSQKKLSSHKNLGFQKIIRLGLVGPVGIGLQGSRQDTFKKIFQTPSRYTPDTLKTPSGQLLDTTTVTLPKLYTCRPFL